MREMKRNYPTSSSDTLAPIAMTRREAIQRAALLLGAAISPSILAGVTSAQPVRGVAGAKPVFLNARQFAIAGAVAERILPRTDTPGALDVGVPAFIDLMYGRFMTEPERRTFEMGLAEVDAASMSRHRQAFDRLNPAQQDAVLKILAEASQAKEKTFFHQLKEMTLLGYFTSEPIAKHVLHYEPVPGRFQGCIPLSAVGNVTWTPLR